MPLLLEVGRAQSNTVFPRHSTGVARWEGALPKHSCSPGPPMVAALSAYCLPLPWEVKVSEPSRERKPMASLGVDEIRNHPSQWHLRAALARVPDSFHPPRV